MNFLFRLYFLKDFLKNIFYTFICDFCRKLNIKSAANCEKMFRKPRFEKYHYKSVKNKNDLRKSRTNSSRRADSLPWRIEIDIENL